MDLMETLKAEFNGHFAIRERRPGVLQILVPLFHEDGDMIDLFLDLPSNLDGPIKITDHGLTLMRLSYLYEIDTPNKRRIFQRILSENGVSEQDGRLYMESEAARLYPAILQFAQTITRISNMQYFRREVTRPFFEILDDFVMNRLRRFHPEPHAFPIPERDDLEVDFWFHTQSRPIFLYGVRDNAKARLTALACLEFQKRGLPFKSVVVHEDFENALSRKDRIRITSAADKQFTSLADFQANGEQFFERELEPTGAVQ